MCCIDWFWSVAKRQLKRFDQVCLCYRVQIHRTCCCQSWYYTENWEKKGRKWTLSWSLEVYDLTLHILFKWARLSWGLCVLTLVQNDHISKYSLIFHILPNVLWWTRWTRTLNVDTMCAFACHVCACVNLPHRNGSSFDKIYTENMLQLLKAISMP